MLLHSGFRSKCGSLNISPKFFLAWQFYILLAMWLFPRHVCKPHLYFVLYRISDVLHLSLFYVFMSSGALILFSLNSLPYPQVLWYSRSQDSRIFILFNFSTAADLSLFCLLKLWSLCPMILESPPSPFVLSVSLPVWPPTVILDLFLFVRCSSELKDICTYTATYFVLTSSGISSYSIQRALRFWSIGTTSSVLCRS